MCGVVSYLPTAWAVQIIAKMGKYLFSGGQAVSSAHHLLGCDVFDLHKVPSLDKPT